MGCARPIVGNEKFAVCLGDEIFPPWDQVNQTMPPIKKLVEVANQTQSSVVGVMEVSESETRSYGMIKIKESTIGDSPVRVLGTVEKPSPEKAPSRFAIIGRYVFSPVIFDYLEKTPKGNGGEIQLTDAMTQLCEAEGLQAVRIQGCRYDIGNPFFYVKAQIDEALRRPELKKPLRDYLNSL